jgi:hypothetical protein
MDTMFDRLIRNIQPDLLADALQRPNPAAPETQTETQPESPAEVICQHPPLGLTNPSPLDELAAQPELMKGIVKAILHELDSQPSVAHHLHKVIPHGSAGQQRIMKAYKLQLVEQALRTAIEDLADTVYFPIGYRILRIPFTVQRADIAAASQGANLNLEKVNLAVH